MTLEEFKKLPYNKRCWALSATYLSKCQNKEMGKKPSKAFWAIRAFFMKQDPSDIDRLWSYLETIEKSNMSLAELYRNAKDYNDNMTSSVNANTNIGDYKRKDLNEWLSSVETTNHSM